MANLTNVEMSEMFKQTKMRVITTLAVLITAAPVYAACPVKNIIFACTTTNNKVLEVCNAGKAIDYSFGKKGAKSELAFSAPRSAVTTNQWQGIGRNMYYSVLIPNGTDTVYEVFSNVDKFGEQTAFGIYVSVNGKQVATVECKPNTVTDNIEGVNLRQADADSIE